MSTQEMKGAGKGSFQDLLYKATHPVYEGSGWSPGHCFIRYHYCGECNFNGSIWGDTAIGCMVIVTNLKFGECLPPE